MASNQYLTIASNCRRIKIFCLILATHIPQKTANHDEQCVHPNRESKIRRCHELKHTAVPGSQGEFLSGKPGIPRTPTDASGTFQSTTHKPLLDAFSYLSMKRCSSCHWDFICLSWVRYNPAAMPFPSHHMPRSMLAIRRIYVYLYNCLYMRVSYSSLVMS